MALFASRSFAQRKTFSPTGQITIQVRHGGANLKELRGRIKSVNSIQKITASMKLVAAAKLRQAQENIESSLPSVQSFSPITQLAEASGENTKVEKLAVIPITADRGLCGSINSGIVRATNKLVSTDLQGVKETDFFVFGEKGRAAFAKDYLQGFKLSLGGFDKKKYIPFEDVMETVDEISKGSYDQYSLVYNHFVNLITYKIQLKHFPPKSKVLEADWSEYEFEGDQGEVVSDLYDYFLATKIYGALVDNSASELSARMSSMENASKNASAMIQQLTIKFNKGRQAAITTELIEIISGAESFRVEAD